MKDFDSGFTTAELAQMGNIADELDRDMLSKIGMHVKQCLEIDEDSRTEWLGRHDKAMDLAMQVSEFKDWPWEGASNIIYPMITTGAIQFAARARPALIGSKNIVKCEVLGDDSGIFQVQTGPDGQPVVNPQTGEPEVQEIIPEGHKAGKAERVSQHMNFQLQHEMPNWIEDTDALLQYLAIAGCAFRKTFFDTKKNAIASRWIPASQLVVNMDAEDLETAPRISECFYKYPYEIEEMVRRGQYSVDEDDDIRAVLKAPDSDKQDEEAVLTLVEMRVRLDIDGDGYPEPYVVIFHRDSGYVLAIYNNFEEVEGSLDNVVSIKGDIPFTKYDFLPNPANGFYGIGLGWLLGPLNEQVNTTINQLNDAGTLQNTPMGFMARGLRIKSGDHAFQPGEFKQVDSTGGSIRENLYQLQFPGPSPVLFQLLGLMIDSAQDISSVKDIMMGDSQSNLAPTTAMTMVEQGSKQFNSIFQRVHRCLAKEFKRMFELNSKTLSADKYFRFLDVQQQIQIEDYDLDSLDVAPQSDPNMATDQKRAAQLQGVLQGQQIFGPLQNIQETQKFYYETLQLPEPSRFVAPPPQPQGPDPDQQAKLMKAQADMLRAQTEQQAAVPEALKTFAEITEVYSKALLNTERAESESDGVQYAQQMLDLAQKLRDITNGPEGIQSMAGGPPNPMGPQGVPQAPGPAMVGPNGGMPI